VDECLHSSKSDSKSLKMETYIALLRGINVNGQKKIQMTNLKLMLTKLGFKEVVTYIQSGNIVFKANALEKDVLEEKIKKQILNVFGFEVPVLIKTIKEVEAIIVENPFKELIETGQIYFVLLQGKLDRVLVEKLSHETYKNETFVITDSCIYLNCENGYGKAKCNNNLFERKLKVAATTRNYKTMNKLLELAIS